MHFVGELPIRSASFTLFLPVTGVYVCVFLLFGLPERSERECIFIDKKKKAVKNTEFGDEFSTKDCFVN